MVTPSRTVEYKSWVIIPARGGSVGIPRKNLRMLGGKPLIAWSIAAALEVLPRERVIVVTDDLEISAVAEECGASVVLETQATPSAETLDTKIVRNIPRLVALGAKDEDVLLTIQPTSPLLRPETVRKAIAVFEDTRARSVLTVADDRHLRWIGDGSGNVVPGFTARVNRQELPETYRETGGIIGARIGDIATHGTRVLAPTEVIVLGEDEAIDIDTYSDLYATAHLLSRKKVALRVDASTRLGMGHVYRMLAVASELARHEVTIYLSKDQQLGIDFFARFPYRTVLVSDDADFFGKLAESQADLVILDVLDTTHDFVESIRAACPASKVVTFEDCGSGASAADLLISEFVTNDDVPEERKLSGIDFAVLSPVFESGARVQHPQPEAVSEVLVLFGGTDPSQLALRALRALQETGYTEHVTVVRGLGAAPLDIEQSDLPFRLTVLENVPNMPAIMSAADLAFTSAGRTVIELISRGVPSICMAQNAKEMSHTHATEENGVSFLGLGTEVSDADLNAAVSLLLESRALREEYASRAWTKGVRRTNQRTISEMLGKIGFEDFPNL